MNMSWTSRLRGLFEGRHGQDAGSEPARRAARMPFDFDARERFLRSHIFIHTHVEKTAGTALTYGLGAIVGWTYAMDTRLAMSVQAREMPRPVADSLRLYTGHFLWGAHRYFQQRPLYVATVREPTERAVSFYRYVVTDQNHPGHKLIGNSDFASAMAIFREHNRHIAHNGQARVLGGIRIPEPVDRDALLKHVEDSYFLVVPQEQVNHAVRRLREAFGLPGLLAERPNTGRGEMPTLEPEILRRLEEWNAVDAALYRHACERFDEQLENACDFIRRGCGA